MSAINDALKRAKQALEKHSKSTADNVPPPSPGKHASFPWQLIGISVLMLAGAGIFISMAMVKHAAPQPVPQPIETAPAIVVAAQKSEAPVPIIAAAVKAPEITNTPATSAVPVVVAAPAPQLELKLQGIFYDSKQPSAIVNRHTVSVGNTVAGFRVTAISKISVTLVSTNGQQKILTLQK